MDLRSRRPATRASRQRRPCRSRRMICRGRRGAREEPTRSTIPLLRSLGRTRTRSLPAPTRFEHGIDIDDETIAEMAKRGSVGGPTFESQTATMSTRRDVVRLRARHDPAAAGNTTSRRTASRVGARFKAGVKLAMGSDAACCIRSFRPVHPRALGWFVRAGMTPAQRAGGCGRPCRRRLLGRGEGGSGALRTRLPMQTSSRW
jgi:hypothetical protein